MGRTRRAPAKGGSHESDLFTQVFGPSGYHLHGSLSDHLRGRRLDGSYYKPGRRNKIHFGPDEDDSRRHHSTTVTVGGGGKLSLPLQPIHSIAVRCDDRVNAIIINGDKFGDDGGDLSDTLTLAEGEYINKIEVRHGEAIDGLGVWTNKKNRYIGGGGPGGRFIRIEGEILAIGAKANDQHDKYYPLRLRQLKIMGTGLSISEGFADEEGGHWFPLEKIKYIAINGDESVDAIWINEKKHGGNGGGPLGALTLAEGEFINRIEVRYGNRIDRLVVRTNKERQIGGGGDGGSLAIREGEISEIGGWSNKKLDDLVVKGKFMPSFEDIDSKPSMELVYLKAGTESAFEDQYRNIRFDFDPNIYPLNYHTCGGHRWEHFQDMLRLPDVGNKQYYMGTFSQNCTNDEGGMVFVGELEKGQTTGKVIWLDELNNSHLAGGYNHPGDLRRIGHIVVIAGQNWDGGTWGDACISEPMHRGHGSYQNVLFYDVSDPVKPQYIGKLNSCWRGLENFEVSGDIDDLSAAKSGDWYYLSFNGLKCRSKVFYPHAGWELIQLGDDQIFSSPLRFNYGPDMGYYFVGGASAEVEKYTNIPVVFDNLVFTPPGRGIGPNYNLTPQTTAVTRERELLVLIPKDSLPKGATFSCNALAHGRCSIVITNVESDGYIGIQELESR